VRFEPHAELYGGILRFSGTETNEGTMGAHLSSGNAFCLSRNVA